MADNTNTPGVGAPKEGNIQKDYQTSYKVGDQQRGVKYDFMHPTDGFVHHMSK